MPAEVAAREVTAVKAAFDRTEQYLRENSSIPVRAILTRHLTAGLLFTRYIDIGCGDGSIGVSLLDESRHLTLLDLSEQMVARARLNTPAIMTERVSYEVGDVHDYAPERPFDLLICIGVLAHVRSVPELLRAIARLVGDRGYLILQFTESRSVAGRLIHTFASRAFGGYEMNKTSLRDLRPLLADLGFSPVKRVCYSDSSIGLRRISVRAAVLFKLFTSRLHMPYVFSESIVLFRRTNTRGTELGMGAR